MINTEKKAVEQTNNVVELKNVSFKFNEKNTIFTDLSFEIKKDTIITIVGNSGTGKSTLLNIVSGLLSPNSGNVSSSDSAYLTQNITLFSYKNAFENAVFATILRNCFSEQKINEANQMFELFNLTNISKTKFPCELSGGMQQKIAIIQTLLIESDVYLLDEPFNAIDRNTCIEILECIWQRFKSNKLSSIIVTHDIEHAILISDEILILSSEREPEFLVFEEEYIKQSPKLRMQSEFYKKYIFELINKLSNS